MRNFTDIDDKIIRRANEAGETATNLSSRFIDEFLHDMVQLQCLPPTHEPRVTDHIKQIIDLITKIKGKDKAYVIEGEGVYFLVDNFPEYLSLSGRKLEHNLPGSRVAIDTRKRNPADFALWKSAKDGEPFWESPWGRGRPGRHIECSAMSEHYLGQLFDIHGGGKDLIFPHHENELAQSRAANSKSEVKCWNAGCIMALSTTMARKWQNQIKTSSLLTYQWPRAPPARDAWIATNEIPQGRLPGKGEPGKLPVRSLATCWATVPGRSRVPGLRGSQVGPAEQWRQDHTAGGVHLMR